jgi:hypothetical protein
MDEQFLAEKKEAFLKDYRELVKKHGFDFFMQPPAIVEVSFPPEVVENKDAIS